LRLGLSEIWAGESVEFVTGTSSHRSGNEQASQISDYGGESNQTLPGDGKTHKNYFLTIFFY